MELKVSRPIQILLLVLVIAGVGGIASMQMLGKGSSSGAAALTPDQVRARAHHTSVQALHTATPAAPKSPVVATKHATSHAPKPAVTKPTPPANGLPVVLNDLFRRHRIVVVSIFDPQDKTDAISYAEARAGAADAGAGFLGVSVLDDSVAGPLTAALPDQGLLPVPGVLIYRRPGVLIQRVDGFQDRDGVAQLAAGAVTAPPLAPAATAAAPVAAVPTAAPTTTTP